MAIVGVAQAGIGAHGPSVRRVRPQYAIRRSTLVAVVLHAMAWLALFRATGMWFGYPSTQQENAYVEPATQQALLYSLIPLIGVYMALEPARILAALTRIPPAVAVLALLLVASTVMSADLVASLRGLSAVIVISLPLLLFKEHCGSEATFRMLRRFAAAALLVNVAYTVAFPGYGIMGGSLAGSMRGMFMHKNLFGQFSAIAFVLLLPSVRMLLPLRWSTLLYGFAAVLALACVVLSLSSTALVLVIIGSATVGFVALMRRVPGMALRSYLYLLALTLCTLAAYTLGTLIAAGVAEAVGKDLTLSGRTELWQALIPAVFEHPFVGHGFALFRQTEYLQAYTANIAWGPRSTHNSYIELALNAGIPAAATWIIYLLPALARKALVIPPSRRLLSIRSREVAVIVMVAVGCMTEAGLIFAPLVTWVLLLASLGSPEDRPPARRPGRRPIMRNGV